MPKSKKFKELEASVRKTYDSDEVESIAIAIAKKLKWRF